MLDRIPVFNRLTHSNDELVDTNILDSLLKEYYGELRLFLDTISKVNDDVKVNVKSIQKCKLDEKDKNIYFILSSLNDKQFNRLISSIDEKLKELVSRDKTIQYTIDKKKENGVSCIFINFRWKR